jgi:hypothetical protein
MIVGAIADALRRPEVSSNGLGWMIPDRWARLQDQLLEHGRIVAPTEVGAIFTNQFLVRGLYPSSWADLG